MAKSLLFLSLLIASFAAECIAQGTTVYRLVVPPSATVSGSGCACNGACGKPDSTWLLAGSYSARSDCQAAIPNAMVSITDSSGNRTSNNCSQTAQCVPGSLGH